MIIRFSWFIDNGNVIWKVIKTCREQRAPKYPKVGRRFRPMR